MNFERNYVARCSCICQVTGSGRPSLYSYSDEESKQSKTNFCTKSWHQKDKFSRTSLARNEGDICSVTERKCEPADCADGHDNYHDEAEADGTHEIMACSSDCCKPSCEGPGARELLARPKINVSPPPLSQSQIASYAYVELCSLLWCRVSAGTLLAAHMTLTHSLQTETHQNSLTQQ